MIGDQAWHEQRRRYVGASDAPIIMRGEPDQLEALRMEKVHGVLRPPVLKPWDLAVRRAAEPLIIDWYEESTKRPVTRRGEHVVSDKYPFMAANLDGYDSVLHAPLDAKCVSEWTKDGPEWCREHYAWQIVHQMIVTGATLGALLVMWGTREPVQVGIAYDPFDAEEMIERERWFWGHVQRDEPIPGAQPAVPAPKSTGEPLKPVLKKLDMTGNNAWADAAARWAANRDGAKAFEEAVKDVKALVGKDVGEATGHGIKAVRDGRGVSIKEIET